jgi:DNA-binding transcriptional ArsR family regulator
MEAIRRSASDGSLLELRRSTPSIEVDVEWFPTYECLIGLNAFASPDIQGTFESGRAPFDRIRTSLSPRLLASMERLGPNGGRQWQGALLGLAWHERLRDVPALLAYIRGVPDLNLQIILLGSHWPALRAVTAPEVFVGAAQGDPAARDELLRNAARYDEEKNSFRSLQTLSKLEPRETKATLLDILEGWQESVFGPDQERVQSLLARDADAKRHMAPSMSPEKLIEVATHGLEYRSSQWSDRVVLVPQLAMRPWNVFSVWDRATLICYPADDEPQQGDLLAPTPQLVRLHKALGDERRLRMLKLLSKGSATLQELAGAAGIVKSSAHHHTVILRAAGLVTVTLEDTVTRYSLRREAIPEVSGWLQAFLEGGNR